MSKKRRKKRSSTGYTTVRKKSVPGPVGDFQINDSQKTEEKSFEIENEEEFSSKIIKNALFSEEAFDNISDKASKDEDEYFDEEDPTDSFTDPDIADDKELFDEPDIADDKESFDEPDIADDKELFDDPDIADNKESFDAPDIVALDDKEEYLEISQNEEYGIADFNTHFAASANEGSQKKLVLRAIVVVFVFILTFVLALCTGAGLALFDTNKSPSELVLAINDLTGKDSAKESGNLSADNEDIASDGLVSDSDDAEVDSAGSDSAAENSDNAETAGSDADMPSGIDGSIAEETGMAQMTGIGTIVAASDGDVIAASEDGASNADPYALPSDYVNPDTYYPLPFETVDESYFSDALFIGDSRMQGFGMYSGLSATYYCATGYQLYNYASTGIVQTPSGKVPLFAGLPYNAFTKIYIKVGLNELGWGSKGQFEQLYADVITQLKEREPRAVIYIHGILPVTAAKSATDKAHCNEKIFERNESLKQLAIDCKAYYIDINSVVSQADGSLMPDMTSDGIHLKAGYMDIWKEYLKTHAVVVP